MSTLKRPELEELIDGIEPLPAYVAEEDGQGSVQALLSGLLQSTDDGPGLDPTVVKELLEAEHQRRSDKKQIGRFSSYYGHDSDTDELAYLADAINRALFDAIAKGQSEYIALLLDNKLIDPNTIDRNGKSPLLAAVEAQRVRIVQELVDFGAETDEYAVAVCLSLLHSVPFLFFVIFFSRVGGPNSRPGMARIGLNHANAIAISCRDGQPSYGQALYRDLSMRRLKDRSRWPIGAAAGG
jgi:hypothetical protein